MGRRGHYRLCGGVCSFYAVGWMMNGFFAGVVSASIGLWIAAIIVGAYDPSMCKHDAKMMGQNYKYSHATCYIQQGNKYYPEDMLKHVTVGDEDFE